MKYFKTCLIILITLVYIPSMAQDDLFKELTKEQTRATQYAIGTFSGTRVINGQSVETKRKGELEFIFSHRFGTINTGSYNFWGLDDAFVRLGFEYGITDRLGIAVGRTSLDKTFDGYLRYNILKQSQGVINFPLTITAIGTGYIQSSPQASLNPTITLSDRLAYSASILIARKFNTKFSMQLTPIFVHRNTVPQNIDNKDDLAIGFAGRYKISRSMALSTEYYYGIDQQDRSFSNNSLGVGLDIETGGHVFQLILTNSLGMFDRSLVSETNGDFFDGDIHFGFNVTRTFQLIHPK